MLDGLSPEEVLNCNTEEESVELIKQLKPTESALLNWAVDLMADVVEEEESNKMNARNIAMVFAPNMTQVEKTNITSISPSGFDITQVTDSCFVFISNSR